MSVHDADYAKVNKALGIPADEPIFVIRGQDRFAVPAIRQYAAVAEMSGEPTPEWVTRVRDDAQAMGEWQEANPDRIKVPD